MFAITFHSKGAVGWGDALDMTLEDQEEYLRRMEEQQKLEEREAERLRRRLKLRRPRTRRFRR